MVILVDRLCNLIPFATLHQTAIVIHQHLRFRHDSPFDPPEKLEFEQGEFLETDTAHASIGVVSPEGIAEPFARYCGAGDEEPVHGQGGDGKGRVQGTEAVNIVDHT